MDGTTVALSEHGLSSCGFRIYTNTQKIFDKLQLDFKLTIDNNLNQTDVVGLQNHLVPNRISKFKWLCFHIINHIQQKHT